MQQAGRADSHQPRPEGGKVLHGRNSQSPNVNTNEVMRACWMHTRQGYGGRARAPTEAAPLPAVCMCVHRVELVNMTAQHKAHRCADRKTLIYLAAAGSTFSHDSAAHAFVTYITSKTNSKCPKSHDKPPPCCCMRSWHTVRPQRCTHTATPVGVQRLKRPVEWPSPTLRPSVTATIWAKGTRRF